MESIETTGATVEEAISVGLKALGVDSSMVMVEVIEDADQGIMGHGAHPARVRLILMGKRLPEPKLPSPPTASPKANRAPRQVRQPRPPQAKPQPKPVYTAPAEDEITDDNVEEIAIIGKTVLSELLTHMGIENVQVGIRAAGAADSEDEAAWILNISGENVTRLIGHRGETLAALQYLTRLIASRRTQSHSELIVDAAGYKSQRASRLEQLAYRMADQAIQQRRTITLEPMPPHERRIIHLALRSRKDIVTRSIGEGKSRKVTISPTGDRA